MSTNPYDITLTAYRNSTYGFTFSILSSDGAIDVAADYSDVQLRIFRANHEDTPDLDYTIGEGLELSDTNKLSGVISEAEIQDLGKYILYWEMRFFFTDGNVETYLKGRFIVEKPQTGGEGVAGYNVQINQQTHNVQVSASDNAVALAIQAKNEAEGYAANLNRAGIQAGDSGRIERITDDESGWQITPLEVPSVAHLQGLDYLPDGATLTILDYHNGIDGGGGPVVWKANMSKSMHNGGEIFSPTHGASIYADTQDANWFSADPNDTGTGCFVRPAAIRIDIRRFGAVGDNSTVNTHSLRAVIDYCRASGRTVYVPEGIFLTSSMGTIFLAENENIRIIGEGRGSVIRRAPDTIHNDFTRTIFIKPHATTDLVSIEGIYIDGNRRNQPDVVAAGVGFDFQQCALIFVFENFSNVRIHNCWFEDPIADCIWVNEQNYADVQDITLVSRNATRSDILFRDVRSFYVNNVDTLERGSRPSRIEIENLDMAPEVDVIRGSYNNCRIGQFEVGGPVGTSEFLDIKVNNLETFEQFYPNHGKFTVKNSRLRVHSGTVNVRRSLRYLIMSMSDCEYNFPYDEVGERNYTLNTAGEYNLKFRNVDFVLEPEGALTFAEPNSHFIRCQDRTPNSGNSVYFESCDFDERIPVCLYLNGGKLTTKNNNFASNRYGLRVTGNTADTVPGEWHSEGDRVAAGGLVTFGGGNSAAPIIGRISGSNAFGVAGINIENHAAFSSADVKSSRKITGPDPTGTPGFEGDEVTVVDSAAGTVTKYVATATGENDANWVQL